MVVMVDLFAVVCGVTVCRGSGGAGQKGSSADRRAHGLRCAAGCGGILPGRAHNRAEDTSGYSLFALQAEILVKILTYVDYFYFVGPVYDNPCVSSGLFSGRSFIFIAVKGAGFGFYSDLGRHCHPVYSGRKFSRAVGLDGNLFAGGALEEMDKVGVDPKGRLSAGEYDPSRLYRGSRHV